MRYRVEGTWKLKNKKCLIPACVPGCVHLDLMRQKLLPDIFVSNNEEKQKWIQEMPWTYEGEFLVEKDILNKKHIEIVFEGIDTVSKVYLNGKKILETNNMFVPYSCEVKNLLKETNQLKILFPAYAEIGRRLTKKYGKNKTVAMPDPFRPYIRRAQYQSGWDWQINAPTVGIWKPIYIEAWDNLKIESLWLRTLEISKKKVTAELEVEFFAEPGKYTFEIEIDGIQLKKTIEINKTGKYIEKIPVEIKNPKLWYPAGYGPQNLYRLNLTAKNTDGTVEDYKQLTTGFRKIELVTDKKFIFVINGIKVYAKGFNWIPVSAFPSLCRKARYKKLIQLALEAGANMLRVWGGGFYENDIFYELCNKYGIMIWHDFMFACSEYPEHPEFIENVRREIIYNVKKLRNHPCIILWCGDNENETIFGKQHKGWIISNKIIPEILKQLDPERPYWPSSPCIRNNIGDTHNWKVWGQENFWKYEEDASYFASEFGWQSFPGFKTFYYMLPKKSEQKLCSKAMLTHQKAWGIQGMKHLIKFIKEQFGPGVEKAPIEDFIILSQLLQALALKYGIESYRRKKFKNSGALIWQLHDTWPVISWSVVDYFLQKKVSYWYVKRAFKPVLAGLDKTGNLWVVNDTMEELEGEIDLLSYTAEGKLVYSSTAPFKVKQNSAINIEWAKFDVENYIHRIILKTDSLTVQNFAVFKNLFEFKLPAPKIRYKTIQNRIEIESKTVTPLIFVEGVNPEENALFLFPEEKRVINFSGDSKSIKIYAPVTYWP